MSLPSDGISPGARNPESQRRHLVRFALIVAGLLLISVALWHRLSDHPQPTMQWLTSTEFSQATAIGPLQARGYRVMNLTAPLWRGYFNRRPQLIISAQLYELTGEAGALSALWTPSSTNADGERAWLLSPKDLKTLKEEVERNGDIRLVTQARIQTVSGVRCTVVTGTSASVPTDLRLDARAQVTPGWIRLLAGVSSANNRGTASFQSINVWTNLETACRVRFPDRGGLLLAGPFGKSGARTNYCVVLSGTALDSKGNPVKSSAPSSLR